MSNGLDLSTINNSIPKDSNYINNLIEIHRRSKEAEELIADKASGLLDKIKFTVHKWVNK